MSTSRRQKPYADPTGRFARILERHEAQIARHTAIQSGIAGWQLFIGGLTTAALIYVAYQQYLAADRQATIADRQAKLEFAKVAPQFTISASMFPTMRTSSIPNGLPKEIQIRILRGEADIERIDVAQELEISRIYKFNGRDNHATCIFRVRNYFERKPASLSEFAANEVIRTIPQDTSWFQDSLLDDYLIISPQNTLVTIWYRDLLGDKRSVKFAGTGGALSQIPSGDFSKSDLYETVDVHVLAKKEMRVPGSFNARGADPVTKGCRSAFGLPGGKARFY